MPHATSTVARANRGADLLDLRLPGWERYIRAACIDMDDSRNCILAQLTQRDRRVRQYMLTIMHPKLAAASLDSYHGAAMFIFGAWPTAKQMYEYGFDGPVWAQVGRERRVNLLDGAWFNEVVLRGGARGGRPFGGSLTEE
jgi:hypothetical protein